MMIKDIGHMMNQIWCNCNIAFRFISNITHMAKNLEKIR